MLDTQEVSGSSPLPPTIMLLSRGYYTGDSPARWLSCWLVD